MLVARLIELVASEVCRASHGWLMLFFDQCLKLLIGDFPDNDNSLGFFALGCISSFLQFFPI